MAEEKKIPRKHAQSAPQLNLKEYLALKSKMKKPFDDYSLSKPVKFIIAVPLFILLVLFLGYIFYIKSLPVN